MRTRPAHRKQRRRDARWLVTGLDACTAILHHGRTAHLQPVRASDHSCRYSAGQRLAVKPYIPGPTEAHVIVTRVQGINETFRLGDVTDQIARDLGHEGADTFRIWWVRAEDHDWWQRTEDEHRDLDGRLRDLDAAYEKVRARFEHRWAAKLAWLIRFRVDISAAPHLLAARSDELYVENPAMALPDELPALRRDEWELHVGQHSPFRERARLRAQKREREARDWPERLTLARDAARAKGYDVRDECRRYERLDRAGPAREGARAVAAHRGARVPRCRLTLPYN
jgi:hypothetical protein